jgi:hypothetical protein
MIGRSFGHVLPAVAGFFLFLSFAPAHAEESAMDACRRWTGNGGGEQYKCFDCLRAVGNGPNERWINTCADETLPGRPRPGWISPFN